MRPTFTPTEQQRQEIQPERVRVKGSVENHKTTKQENQPERVRGKGSVETGRKGTWVTVGGGVVLHALAARNTINPASSRGRSIHCSS